MRQSLEVHFCADHPTAAGHFPGNPIIPGAVLLDEVLRAIAGDSGSIGQSAIRSAKFLEPVRPGTGIVIRWEIDSNGQARFECQSLDSGRLVASGTVRVKVAAR